MVHITHAGHAASYLQELRPGHGCRVPNINISANDA